MFRGRGGGLSFPLCSFQLFFLILFSFLSHLLLLISLLLQLLHTFFPFHLLVFPSSPPLPSINSFISTFLYFFLLFPLHPLFFPPSPFSPLSMPFLPFTTPFPLLFLLTPTYIPPSTSPLFTLFTAAMSEGWRRGGGGVHSTC